jgi:hypothetical protein
MRGEGAKQQHVGITNKRTTSTLATR